MVQPATVSAIADFGGRHRCRVSSQRCHDECKSSRRGQTPEIYSRLGKHSVQTYDAIETGGRSIQHGQVLIIQSLGSVTSSQYCCEKDPRRNGDPVNRKCGPSNYFRVRTSGSVSKVLEAGHKYLNIQAASRS